MEDNILNLSGILTVDDSRNIDSIGNIFKNVGINEELTLARNVDEGLKFLEQGYEKGTLPKAILFDTCFMDYVKEDVDYDWGRMNAYAIIDWYKAKGLGDKLPFIVFQSADLEPVLDACHFISKRYDIKTYPVDQYEPTVLSAKVKGLAAPQKYLDNRKTEGLREFFGDFLSVEAPSYVDVKEVEKTAELSKRNPKEIFNDVAAGRMSRTEALNILGEAARETAKKDSLDKVMLPEGDDEVKGIAFKAYADDAISGVAAFSIAEIKKFKYAGKKPILVMDSYDANIVPFFKELQGLVMLSPSESGHLKILLKGYNVSGLLGVSNLGSDENFPFLRNVDGTPFSHALRFEKDGDVTYLADYTKSVVALATHHKSHFCSECSDEEAAQEIKIPPRVVDLNKMKADRKIYPGDNLTIDTNGMLYKGEFQVAKGDLNKERHHWINTVLKYLREESEQVANHHINFKVSLDYPEQKHDKYPNDGIGLIRTEHFILSQADQQALLKQVLLDQTHKGLQKLSYGLQQDLLIDVFSTNAELNEKPKRIRLLDMPIKELSLTPEEQDRFDYLYGTDGPRGVQLAMKFPAIYEAQLKGIFSAMRKNKDRNLLNGYANVEIMVPTVKTEQELNLVRVLTNAMAARFEIPKTAYKFGSMIETMEACNNIEAIVKNCDFISMGTNDLTSEVHQCPRDNSVKREELSDKKGFDPFVLLTKEVSALVKQNIKRARAVKPDLQIDVCGDHACKLENLRILASGTKEESINGISLPPSARNLIDLRLQHDYEFVAANTAATIPQNKALVKKSGGPSI